MNTKKLGDPIQHGQWVTETVLLGSISSAHRGRKIGLGQTVTQIEYIRHLYSPNIHWWYGGTIACERPNHTEKKNSKSSNLCRHKTRASTVLGVLLGGPMEMVLALAGWWAKNALLAPTSYILLHWSEAQHSIDTTPLFPLIATTNTNTSYVPDCHGKIQKSIHHHHQQQQQQQQLSTMNKPWNFTRLALQLNQNWLLVLMMIMMQVKEPGLACMTSVKSWKF
jgi:hypothetical protein